jgi:hypothetical protein
VADLFVDRWLVGEDMVVLETERDSREQQRCKDRKRQREPEDTNAKKAKDKEEETDLDNLDLEEVKPISRYKIYITLST